MHASLMNQGMQRILSRRRHGANIFCCLQFSMTADQVDDSACKMLVMPFQGQGTPNSTRKGKMPPPDETSEEAAYLKGLGEKQKQVSIKLADGEVVHGWIEYYDRNMVRLTRETGPNLFIFKHEIMYIAEDGKHR
jgi:host factor-I protein